MDCMKNGVYYTDCPEEGTDVQDTNNEPIANFTSKLVRNITQEMEIFMQKQCESELARYFTVAEATTIGIMGFLAIMVLIFFLCWALNRRRITIVERVQGPHLGHDAQRPPQAPPQHQFRTEHGQGHDAGQIQPKYPNSSPQQGNQGGQGSHVIPIPPPMPPNPTYSLSEAPEAELSTVQEMFPQLSITKVRTVSCDLDKQPDDYEIHPSAPRFQEVSMESEEPMPSTSAGLRQRRSIGVYSKTIRIGSESPFESAMSVATEAIKARCGLGEQAELTKITRTGKCY